MCDEVKLTTQSFPGTDIMKSVQLLGMPLVETTKINGKLNILFLSFFMVSLVIIANTNTIGFVIFSWY